MRPGREGRGLGTSIVRITLVLIMLVLPIFGSKNALIQGIDNDLSELRFSHAPRKATGDFVFIAIDKLSLDTVGVWPWPRSVYADLVDRLVGANVADIFIDIDFSTPSTPAEDRRFADALNAAGGAVMLPIFRQSRSADAGSTLELSQPIPQLADNAWLAFANVYPDSDGVVRAFEAGDTVDGVQTQSAPAALSGTELMSGTMLIDFSIDPATVPTYSVSAILDGSVPQADLKGRSVVIGAYATELKDVFPVPVYGLLSGPMLHILAAETVVQNRMLTDVDQSSYEILFAVFITILVLSLRRRPVVPVILALLVIIAFTEAAAFFLQKESALVLHTGVAWIVVCLGLFMLMNEKVDFAGLLLEIANSEHRNTRRLLKKIVTDSTDGVIAFDEHLRVIEESRSVRPLLGLSPANGRGVPLDVFLPVALADPVSALVARFGEHPADLHSLTVDFALPHLSPARHLEAAITISPVERPSENGMSHSHGFAGCMIIRDMTAHQRYQDTLERLSRYDDLTGLLNRREFTRRLDEMAEPCHVAVLDLHRFTSINSALGRDTGDEILKAVAARLTLANSGGLVGRLGGDVFCLAMRCDDQHDAKNCAEMLLGLFDKPFDLNASTVPAEIRLGFCERPNKDISAAACIGFAEHALDDVKMSNGPAWQCYDTASAAKREYSRRLERELRPALERQEFFLLYQPQITLKNGTLCGAEALIRWQHGELGLVSPLDFIPLAEANGFIRELGAWVLDEACRQAAAWPEPLTVAVNVSAVQLKTLGLVEQVRAALAKSGLAAERLQLEITETVFIDGMEHIVETIGKLRDLGVSIALDDFGTGYSSLSYIVGLPLDKLKIDQSFVRKMGKDPATQTIVQTIMTMSHGLGLKVVAEGIETEFDWKLLRMMGCEHGQGYFFGKPQTSAELLSLLDAPHWSEVKAS